MAMSAGTRLGPYEILAPLGAGGMGEVYRARDPRLDREVAIKVLPETASGDTERLRRFEQEARAASALNHPNIVTIHDIGEHEGNLYIAMEYVKGKSLREILREPLLPARRMLQLATQIARGLAKAHSAGIVHRDLKPENLMVTADGLVKILDFGLAKLVLESPETASEAKTATRATREGTVLGTVQYMSPEQAAGRAVDHRSDQFSLGSILYEMATGKIAYLRDTGPETQAAIMRDEPEPISALNPHVPAQLTQIIGRCLEKAPQDRYDSTRDLARELESVDESPPVALPTPSLGELRWPMVLLALVAVAGLGWWFLWNAGPSVAPGEISSLAILPLTNLMNNPEQEYFVEGMQEELIVELSHIRALRVISRTSTMKYKNTEKSLPEIAEELKVDALVEGSVFRSEAQVRITLQLVALEPERNLWSSRYDRPLSDVLALHSEVAQAVAREIRVALTPEEQALLSTAREIDPEAYDAYLKGKFYWNKWTLEGTERSAEWFQRSIAIEPDYAPSWAGLSRSLRFPVAMGMESGTERLPLAHEAASRAVELDPSSAEARASLGMSRCLQWNWLDGVRDFQQALELDPNYALGHHSYSNLCLLPMGRLDEALTEIRRARELDPLSLPNNAVLGKVLHYRREYDQSIEQLGTTIDLDPGFGAAHLFLGEAYREKGLFEDAVKAQEKAVSLSRSSWFLGQLGSTYAASGRRNEAVRIADELEQQRTSQYVDPFAIAMVYASLSETDRAFEWLDKALEKRSFGLIWLGLDPRSDSLRSDPRFEQLLRRLKLPEEAIQRHLAVP